MNSQTEKIKIALSSGDPNGIGIEVILKTFSDQKILEQCIPVLYASKESVAFYNKLLGLNVMIADVPSEGELEEGGINVISSWEDAQNPEPGKATANGGKCAFRSLERAFEGVKKGKTDVLVTGPINKDTIQSADFRFPGHTEYLGEKLEIINPLMLMCHQQLRVGVVTGHIPVKEISSALTIELVFEKLEVLNQSLMLDFGIASPKIAVLGLNPHAGESGLLGKEEDSIISPAITKAKKNHINASGPFPADGFFGSKAYAKFDGVIAMYHDQGLVPFKALSFGEGVNYTAGLPIIRTSPDHGVAYELAGKGEASDSSFRAAVNLGCELYKARL